MDELEKQKRLNEIIASEKQFLKENQKDTFKVDENSPKFGSFAHDNPHVHEQYREKEKK